MVRSLQSCELFRQRFFLRPSERGLHWRAGLLRAAKWPVVLLASHAVNDTAGATFLGVAAHHVTADVAPISACFLLFLSDHFSASVPSSCCSWVITSRFPQCDEALVRLCNLLQDRLLSEDEVIAALPDCPATSLAMADIWLRMVCPKNW